MRGVGRSGGWSGGAMAGRRAPPMEKRVPRDVLYARKYVDLEQYVADYKSGRIVGYSHLPRAKRIELFGSSVVPIHVPLARGETVDEYEQRFVQWLEGQGSTLHELETSEDDYVERVYRVRFANWHAKGEAGLESTSKKRSRPADEKELPPKKTLRVDTRDGLKCTRISEDGDLTSRYSQDCILQRPVDDASTEEVADAFLACGCSECVVASVRCVARKISELDQRVS